MANYKGIDVSQHQGNIDFGKVKAAGYDFVIIRAGYGKYASQKDPYFEQNYAGAKAAGLNVGAYWYSYADSTANAKLEAEACLQVIKGKTFEYPIYFDLEERSQFNKGRDFCDSLVKTFCNALESAGYYAGLYISRSPLQTYISSAVATRYALWVAEYASKCNYSGTYGIWQSSSTGKIDGIKGDVDTDISYVDYASVIKSGGFNGFKKQTSAPPTAFVPRLSKPGTGNKYYIRKANGGYSDAILGSPTDPECNVLANCVGYAYGRFNEIGGYGSCKYLRPVNAENFIQNKGDLEVGQTPRLGACMVWQKGATLSGSDGAGHVAIVEKVVSTTEIVTSESGYGSKAFWTQTRKKGDGNWGQASGYKFLGFIYNPAPCCQTTTPTPAESSPEPIKADTKLTFKVGDVVKFEGYAHFANANAANGVSCKPGKAKVTAVSAGAKHPYHLVHTDSTSTVYGWVDEADVKAESASITVGDTVKFAGGPHYASAGATKSSGSPKAGKAKVTAISKGAKHPYHIIHIDNSSSVYGWVDASKVSK